MRIKEFIWQGLKLNSYVLYENVQVYWDFGINIPVAVIFDV